MNKPSPKELQDAEFRELGEHVTDRNCKVCTRTASGYLYTDEISTLYLCPAHKVQSVVEPDVVLKQL